MPSIIQIKMYKLNFEPQASHDYDEAFDYYDLRSEGASLGFQLAFEDGIELISSSPFIGLQHRKHKNVRSLKLDHYPYRIYYLIDKEQSMITILTIFNSFRNPETLKKFFKQP